MYLASSEITCISLTQVLSYIVISFENDESVEFAENRSGEDSFFKGADLCQMSAVAKINI